MSRHKLVKALDLDEELDDFAGGAESDYDEEVSAEDQQQLRRGTARVRDVLGTQVIVSDKEIEDSLWHYYYDIDKTVNYLINAKIESQSGKSNGRQTAKADKDKAGRLDQRTNTMSQRSASETLCSRFCALSAAELFQDSPWLNVPEDRRGEILIEPLYPQGRLLGGSSKPEEAPKSKLAALAAARKKKENQKLADSQSTSSVALLDRLGSRSDASKLDANRNRQTQTAIDSPASKAPDRRYSMQTSRKEAFDSERAAKEPIVPPGPAPKTKHIAEAAPVAAPSTFAQIMFAPLTRFSERDIPIPSRYAVQDPKPHTKFDFAGPSPDDIVIKAQSSKGTAPRSTKVPKKLLGDEKAVNGITSGIASTAIEDTKVKRKNINVLSEYESSKPKNAANFVVIGHVDAGKSTLMGRLLHDLNIVDYRTIDKYKKEAEKLGKSSFALAWVLDQGAEERERGVTIDIAMNKFETADTRFTILDAPGHRDFIPNMIAGASQADFAVLVVDASTGNFESGLKGQTKEHALLVRSIGVQRIVIAVNKLDTVNWSQERFDEISQQVSAFLTTAGFQAKNLAFVPCAGLTGDNIVRKTDNPRASWYTGPPLITLLESSEPIARALEKPLRLTIDDIFRGGVQNPISISGRVDAGSLQIGDVVLIVPAQQTATIKNLDVDSEPAEWAVAGQNVVLHLMDIDPKYLKSGDVICPSSSPVKCVTSFTVKVLAFEHITPMHVEVHRGRLHAPGRLTKLVAQLDKASGAAVKGKTPRLVKPGSVARVVVEVEDPVPLEHGGRVILRAGGETVGAGLVE